MVHIREMEFGDIEAVLKIEKEDFPADPWTDTGFLTHLMRSDALYLVAEKNHLENPAGNTSKQEETYMDSEKEEKTCDVKVEEKDEEDKECSEDGEILGFIGILAVPDEADITKVAVAKDAQGQGIGSMLMKELISRAPKLGVAKIFLEVRESNEAALALYKKFGFEQIGIRKNYYTSPLENAISMKLDKRERQ